MADTRDRWAAAVLANRAITDGCSRTAWAIREFCNRDGVTTVGLSRLARDTDRTARTIERHVRELVTAGYLRRTPGAGVTTRGGTTTLTELLTPDDPPTPGSALNPPTPRSDPPTPVTESTDTRRTKVPTQLCRPNHKEPFEPARGRARDRVARPAQESETYIQCAARLGVKQRPDESIEAFRKRVSDADVLARYNRGKCDARAGTMLTAAARLPDALVRARQADGSA